MQNDFNVARVGHVWVDATVSSVGTSSHFGGFVYLDVENSQLVRLQAFKLSIAFSVPEEIEDVLARLLGETTNGSVVLFEECVTLRVTTNTVSVTTEWYSSLLRNNILKVGLCPSQCHALDCGSSFTGVFEMHSEHGGLCVHGLS